MSALLLLVPALLPLAGSLSAQANDDHITSVENGIVLRPDTFVVDTRNSRPPVENFTEVFVDPATLAERLTPAAVPEQPKPPTDKPSTAPSFPGKGVLPITNLHMSEARVTVNDVEVGLVHALTEAAVHDVKWGCYDVSFAYPDDYEKTERFCTVAEWRTPFPGGPDAAKYLEDGRPERNEPEWRLGPPDSDRDGVANSDDECPTEPGPEASFGCPDGDGDRVPDFRDECPEEKANLRADAKRSDGCPARVFVGAKQIVITDKVYFRTGRATIKRESHGLLDEIAGILAKHPAIKKVEVAGHTDDQGRDSSNLRLSQGRADAVLAYLVDAGIDAARLTGKGYGETAPIADNATDEGRAANRRVEFRIIEQEQRERVVERPSLPSLKGKPGPE